MTLPYRFQLQDVRRLENEMNGRALVCWDMGIGKSYLTCLFLHRNPEALPAIIVCPAPLKIQWQREAARHFGLRAEVLNGVAPTPFGIAGTPPALIVNYDILRSSRHGPGWLDTLKKIKPQTVIIDECQAVKHPTTAQTVAVRELCSVAPRVIALSATPIEIRPIELWSVLNMIAPEEFPSYFSWGHRYCGPRKVFGRWEFKGASNVDSLHNKLKSVMIRRRKADVIDQLPKKIRTVVPLEMSDPEQYREANEKFLTWLHDTLPGKLTGAVRSAGLELVGHMKRLAADLKLAAAMDWIDDWLSSSDGKILLFCIHKKIVKALHDRYRNLSVVVSGSVTGKRRQASVDQFQLNPKTRILIGNIAAAGKGLNLTAAHTAAFLEYPWKPSEAVQAEDRCFARLSDIHGAQIFYLTAVDTIEHRIASMIQSRQKIVTRILDGGVGESLDLFDLLTSELRKGGVK